MLEIMLSIQSDFGSFISPAYVGVYIGVGLVVAAIIGYTVVEAILSRRVGNQSPGSNRFSARKTDAASLNICPTGRAS